jgi:hypothetical protein
MWRKRRPFAARPTILPPKYWNPEDIATRSIFGALELSYTLSFMEDRPSNPKTLKILTKKSKSVLSLSLIISPLQAI